MIDGSRTGAAGRTPATRLDWIDVARGIGIVLVVYEHVMRGIVAAGLAPADAFFVASDTTIYAFHMPLFFVLSGLFAENARRRTARSLSAARVRTLVYPYILWSLIQGGLAALTPDRVNSPVAWVDLMRIGFVPIGQFWFLYALFLCNLALLLPRAAFFMLVPLGAAAELRFGMGNIVVRAGSDLLFFAAGTWLGAARATWAVETRPRALAVASGAWLLFAATLFVFVRLGGPEGPRTAYPVGQVAGLAGAAGTLALARLIRPGAGLLRALGRASMPIYLLHVMVCAALRAVLVRLGAAGQEAVTVALLTLAGLAVPWLVAQVAARLGLERVLGFGDIARGPARPGTADRLETDRPTPHPA